MKYSGIVLVLLVIMVVSVGVTIGWGWSVIAMAIGCIALTVLEGVVAAIDRLTAAVKGKEPKKGSKPEP